MHFFRKHCKLHAAAKTGDAHALKNILDTTPSIQAHNALLESVDHHGKTALLRACKYGHRGAVIALLRAGANLRAIDERKRNCMHHAVANGHVDVAEALLRRGAVALLEQVDAAGKRPLDLHPACNQADIQRVLHQSNSLWTRHNTDSDDLVQVQTRAPPSPVARVPLHRHKSVQREYRMSNTWGGALGGGYFVPPNTKNPLLPAVQHVQDDLQAHVKISRSRTAANPRAGTANSLLTTMPCYMVSAYTQQASSGPDSASDSEGEQTTTEGSSSRSGTPSMASRSSSVSAVWEVPGKDTLSRIPSVYQPTPDKTLTMADILATSRDAWALMPHGNMHQQAPYMLVPVMSMPEAAHAHHTSLAPRIAPRRHTEETSLEGHQ